MEDDLGRPWPRTMRHRGCHWQRNTSPNTAARSQRSGSKYDGAPATAGSKATKMPTSGPSRPPTNRTPAAWNGTWTAVEGRAHHLLPRPHQTQVLRDQVTDASKWVKAQFGTSNSKYRPLGKQKPNAAVARANKKLAARFYQPKTGHCLTRQYLRWTT